jgi:predicted SPOUT superfamily RNA methylase MTH1
MDKLRKLKRHPVITRVHESYPIITVIEALAEESAPQVVMFDDWDAEDYGYHVKDLRDLTKFFRANNFDHSIVTPGAPGYQIKVSTNLLEKAYEKLIAESHYPNVGSVHPYAGDVKGLC